MSLFDPEDAKFYIEVGAVAANDVSAAAVASLVELELQVDADAGGEGFGSEEKVQLQ